MDLHRPLAAACLLVALAGALTACGGDSPTAESGDEPSRAAADPDLPDCAEVWVAGTVLPLDFAGCNEDGTVVDTEPTQDCDDGTSRLFYHRTGPGERDVEMLAITGQKIQEYSLDIDSDLYNECHDITLDD